MGFKGISFFVIFLLSLQSAYAIPPWMNGSAPQIYEVKKGDTLWKIAALYLNEPWRWPEIWKDNPEIENPHLIYPQDKIYLQYDGNGHPRLTVERGQAEQPQTYWQNGERVVKLSPQIRRRDVKSAIPTVPRHFIEPFFNQSRVITSAEVEYAPTVIALDEDHLIVGAGDRIYATGIPATFSAGNFSVFRVEKCYKDPETKESLGIEGLVLGESEIEMPGDPASLLLTKSYSEIRIGDKLIEPAYEPTNAYFFPKPPATAASGQIISVFGGLSQIGQFQVVVITGGDNQQREVGDVLAVYQNQKDMPSRFTSKKLEHCDFPSLKIARLVVFRVFDRVSYALVMSAIRPIYLNDQVGQP